MHEVLRNLYEDHVGTGKKYGSTRGHFWIHDND
jgi:hypothetical protein